MAVKPIHGRHPRDRPSLVLSLAPPPRAKETLPLPLHGRPVAPASDYDSYFFRASGNRRPNAADARPPPRLYRDGEEKEKGMSRKKIFVAYRFTGEDPS